MKPNEKEIKAIVKHYDFLMDLGWDAEEIRALIGEECWLIVATDLIGEEAMERMGWKEGEYSD